MTRAKDISKIISDANFGGTLDVVGKITADAGVDIDNINIDGTTIALSSGDLTIDVEGTIILDGDEAGATVHLKDGGTHWGSIYRSDSNFNIESEASDKDIVFKGNDGGSGITALTLDMSDAGTAVFNNKVGIGESAPGQVLVVRESSTPTIQIKDGAGSGTRVSGRLHIGEADSLGVSIENSTTSFNDNCAMVFKTSPAAGTITERMRIDSAGRVGIGASNNGDYHVSNDDLLIATTGSTGITIASGTADQGRIAFADGTSSDDEIEGLLMYNHNGNKMSFFTASTERITIDSSGRLGCTSHVDMSSILIYSTIGSGGIAIQTTPSGNHSYIPLRLRNSSGTVIGSIECTTSSTTFNTSSDYRLKENVSYSFDATTRLKQLKPARFNFIVDADTTVDGFIAHEVSSIVPEAITGAKDATESMTNVVLNADGTRLTDDVTEEKWVAGKLSTTDEDGNTVDPIYASDTTWVASQTVPKYQSIDQSKLVPLLVKTIQELEARITALEGRM